MITVTLTRQRTKGKAVFGTLTFPLEMQNGTLEEKVTTLENADFLIPAGTYPLRLTWSPRFKKPMPLIDEVPDREASEYTWARNPSTAKVAYSSPRSTLKTSKYCLTNVKNGTTKMSSESQSKDWKQIVVEIVLKIITLGLYHVEKRRNQANGSPE